MLSIEVLLTFMSSYIGMLMLLGQIQLGVRGWGCEAGYQQTWSRNNMFVL